MKTYQAYIFEQDEWEAIMAEHMHTKLAYPMATKFKFSYKDHKIKIEVEVCDNAREDVRRKIKEMMI